MLPFCPSLNSTSTGADANNTQIQRIIFRSEFQFWEREKKIVFSLPLQFAQKLYKRIVKLVDAIITFSK
jgi:hypothetical protein